MKRGEMKVLDASVVLKWFSEEEDTDKALEIRQGILDGKIKVVVPDLLLYEIANVLTHNPNLNENDVIAAFQSILDIGLEIVVPVPSVTESAIKLARRCWYHTIVARFRY